MLSASGSLPTTGKQMRGLPEIYGWLSKRLECFLTFDAAFHRFFHQVRSFHHTGLPPEITLFCCSAKLPLHSSPNTLSLKVNAR